MIVFRYSRGEVHVAYSFSDRYSILRIDDILVALSKNEKLVQRCNFVSGKLEGEYDSWFVSGKLEGKYDSWLSSDSSSPPKRLKRDRKDVREKWFEKRKCRRHGKGKFRRYKL